MDYRYIDKIGSLNSLSTALIDKNLNNVLKCNDDENITKSIWTISL